MKKILTLLVLLISITMFSQVGIGTTSPNGALEITSTNDGLLIPRVALVATNIATVITPTTSELVYNTATSAIGPNQVTPGFYFWNGVKWVATQSSFNTSFSQTANLTTTTTAGYVNIVGLDNKTFVAPYDGNYQIVFIGYLGANKVTTANDVVGYAEGYFKLTINGADNIKYMHSESFHRGNGGGSDYYELFNEVTIIVNVNLTAGSTCTLNSAYDGDNDGNVDAPAHNIGKISGLGNKCSINVTYTGK